MTQDARRILIATDAWLPQVNGVVRTLQNTMRILEGRGYSFEVISPSDFKNYPCPLYSEIRLAVPSIAKIKERMKRFSPDHFHIVTEGPIGLAARKICMSEGWRFSTAFHTMFPDYLWHIAKIPPSIIWPMVRWFHSAGGSTMTPSRSAQEKLQEKGFKNVKLWTRGIDTTLFRPRPSVFPDKDRPILLYVGRISKEKNIEAFLKLKSPGVKYVVGDGPTRPQYEARYPDARFLGYKKGEALAEAYSSADLFVFPSKTETFGNVMLEALACGVPVAAYPAPGPKDVLCDPRYGACHDDLERAVELALKHGDRNACVEYARGFTWEHASDQFVSNLVAKR